MIALDTICKIKEGNQEAAVELMSDNMDYVCYLSKMLGVDSQYYDDFKQIAFLAVLDTATAFNVAFSQHQTFKILWKHYVMQHYLDFKLEQFYSVRISRSTYTKLQKTIGIENSKLKYEYLTEGHTRNLSDIQFNVETYVLNKIFWEEVERVLSVEEYEMVYLFYRLEYHMDYICMKMGLRLGQARNLKNRAIRKLRRSSFIRAFANEFYGLRE